MAKYCSKCGRALPDGVEVCSICYATKSAESDAALFTSMTAETEIWKEAPKPGKRRKMAKRIRSNREKLILYSGAVMLVIITAIIVVFTLPSSVVKRAIKAEDYDKAISVYSDKFLGKENAVDKNIADMLEKKAEILCASFSNSEVDEQQAEETFAKLYSFGLGTDAIDHYYAIFDELKGTQSKLEKAEGLLNIGSYLEACNIFLSIPETDSEYANAQLRASDSLEMYAAGIQATASELMAENSYAEAIAALKKGNDELKAYNTFSSGIDAKLESCYIDYEIYTLAEAKNLADIEQYSGAADLINTCLEDMGRDTDDLLEAFDAYTKLASEKISQEAIKRATEFYDAGSIAEAFSELEAALERSDSIDTVIAAMAALEVRFVDDTIKKTEEVLAGDRANIDAAAQIVEDARQIRRLDGFEEYMEKLDSYRPFDLVQVEYTLRDGDIYRIAETFEAVDGTSYEGGWIWGGEGACISFALGGAYDVFEGVLAVRRDDSTEVEGWFELICDGETKYTSEVISHRSAPLSINVGISGCDEFRMVFHSNYETSTADNGYCYHGICAPKLLKNMTDAQTEAAQQ